MKRKKNKSDLHWKLLKLGRFVFLTGSLVVVGLSSAYLGLRFAVRGSEAEVPSIVGQSVEEARASLGSLDLSVEVIGARFDEDISKGSIISQHPRPGGRIKIRRAVRVIVSLGEKKDPIPELRGSILRVARLLVSESGYELGKISWLAIPATREEEVIRQYPPANSKQILGRKIDVLVSSGDPTRYVMPNVTGLGLNKVLLLFERNGVKVGRIQYRSYPNVPKGIIVKQFPEPGHILRGKNVVNLEVWR